MVTTRGADGSGRKRQYKEVDSSSPEASVGEEEEEANEGVADASSPSPSPAQQQQQQQQQQQVKKRPYRRTKRPLGYNDRSSITTTTETFQPVSAYDAVLQESRDLLRAAAEAQQLGRLKTGASYLLLLHTRLVGLGKRFDRAVAVAAQRGGADDGAPPPVSPGTRRAAQEALRRFLPRSSSEEEDSSTRIELDTAMMEHLARAAAELHARRSGKPLHAGGSAAASPVATATEFLAQTANRKGVTNAATVTGVARAVAAIEQKEAQYWDAPAAAAAKFQNSADAGGNSMNNDASDAAAAVLERLGPQHRSKPATVAMRTVPHANCDARSLLRGAPFYENGSGSSSSVQQQQEAAAAAAAVGGEKSGTDDETESDEHEQPEDDPAAVGWAASSPPSQKNDDNHDNNNHHHHQSSPKSSPPDAAAKDSGVDTQVTQMAVV